MIFPIRLPAVGTVSLWSASDLLEVNLQEQYTIRILGRVLDQIYDIPVDTELMLGATRGPELALRRRNRNFCRDN